MARKPKKSVKFTAVIGGLICSMIAEGQSLRKICALEKCRIYFDGYGLAHAWHGR
jgi:hypothetical protein